MMILNSRKHRTYSLVTQVSISINVAKTLIIRMKVMMGSLG
jgi:hypothetical protein